MLVCKGSLSALFVLVGWLAPATRSDYHALVLAGLVLGMAGDLCLAPPGRLARPLAGAARPGRRSGLPLAAPPCGAHARARDALHRRHQPDAGRGGARAVFRLETTTTAAAWCVLAGALVFYLFDLCVARDRFVSEGFINRLLGLPLYYAGQFLLAWSVGLVA